MFNNPNRMGFCMSAIRLLTLLSLWLVVVKSEDDANFYQALRSPTGHFKSFPDYRDLYQSYFENVLQKNDRAVAVVNQQDWRKARPTADLCLDFLQAFQVKKYILGKPFDIIPLDACLGWLNEKSTEKDMDMARMNQVLKSEYDFLRKDKKLRQFFEKTSFKAGQNTEIPKKLIDDLKAYLLELLEVNANNPTNGCHGLWMEKYNKFIDEKYLNECDEDDEEKCVPFEWADSMKDSYIKLVVDSTREAAKTCYKTMQKQMLMLVQAAHDNESIFSSINNKRKAMFASGKAIKQSEANKWPHAMVKVMQFVTAASIDQPVDLAEVARALKNIKTGDEKAIEVFTTALAKYTTASVDVKDTANDHNGRAKYGKLMASLCRPYIELQTFLVRVGGSTLWDESAEMKPFEFYGLVYYLLKLTTHPTIFGIEKETFERDVIDNKWEALYLTSLTCSVISLSWGQVDNEALKPEYSVTLRPNAFDILDEWPLDSIVDQLAKRSAENEAAAVTEPSAAPSQKKASTFGRKFKLGGLKAKLSSKTENDDLEKALNSAESTPSMGSTARRPKVTAEAAPKTKNVISIDTIKLFKKVHNRYPKDLPANIEELDPQLAADIKRERMAPVTVTTEAPSAKTVELRYDMDQMYEYRKPVKDMQRAPSVVDALLF